MDIQKGYFPEFVRDQIVETLLGVLDQLDEAGQELAAIKLNEALEILAPEDERLAARAKGLDSDLP
ncbi:MAG: hypothetical protein H6918_05245 [Sphingomonadaceae bacterium]|nr:hypothetical protein [Sphingomonadaceae bacterium]